MTDEICLVEVSAWFVQKGDQSWKNELDYYLWETDPYISPLAQSSDKQIALWSSVSSVQKPMDIQFNNDNVDFKFRTFGQSTDEEYSNVLDWSIEMIGIEEVFKDWIPDLKKLAMPILEWSNKKRLAKIPNDPLSYHVDFVTIWEYREFTTPKTSYGGGDWEEEWKLLGLLESNTISSNLVNDPYFDFAILVKGLTNEKP